MSANEIPCRTLQATRGAFLLLFALAIGIIGCGRKTKTAAYKENTTPSASTATDERGDSTASSSALEEGITTLPARVGQAAVPARFRQSFAKATREERPKESDNLPKQTLTGKSVGVLYEDVHQNWDNIKLVSDTGRVLIYPVTLQTSAGDIELELHPEWAPNHVRSFLALVQAGYYDGLTFDRRIQQESDREEIPTLNMIEAGCPLGLGVHDFVSIGYWLKAELDPSIKHDEGIVGAWHGDDPDTAACRFYICLGKAPTLDGRFTAFAKVVNGLDIARTIFNQPHRLSDDDEEGCHRFEEPPVIRKVTVHPSKLGVAAAEK